MPKFRITEISKAEAAKADRNPNHAPKETHAGKITARNSSEAIKKLSVLKSQGKFGGSAQIAGEVGEVIKVRRSSGGASGRALREAILNPGGLSKKIKR